jgi:hypothetical protein
MQTKDLPGRLGQVSLDGELPVRGDIGSIFDELDYQMACQAYLWALPLVSCAQWQQQHREVFGATSTDLVHYVSYQDRLGIITANATTPYILGIIPLGETGPVVIELPPGQTVGGVTDFWWREVGAMGEMGPDKGQGGRHLVVPPGKDVPPDAAEYNVLKATTMNVMLALRVLDPDPVRSKALVDGVRIYPYDRRADASPTRVISPGGRRWSGGQPRGIDYWVRLHDIYQSEIVDERDRFYLAMLKQLGIAKDGPFAPDDRLARILTTAAIAGELMAQANTFAKRFEGARWWPDRQWDLAIQLDHPSQRGPYYDQLLERAAWFYEAVGYGEAMKSQTPGLGQAYLGVYTDVAGEWLDGGKAYALHVPSNVPAKLFWSATVYDVGTRCLIDNEQQRGDRGSRDSDVHVNGDASVDLFFGPTAPAGRESNWVQTIPGKHWFSYFRLYGPLESYFDRSWKLGDITVARSP